MRSTERNPAGKQEADSEPSGANIERGVRQDSGVTELWRHYEEDDLIRLVEERFQGAVSASARSEANLVSLHRAIQDASRSLTAGRQAQDDLLDELRQTRALLRALTSQNAALERYSNFLAEERDAALKDLEQARLDADRMRRGLVEEQDRFIQVLLEDHDTALRQLVLERNAAGQLAKSLSSAASATQSDYAPQSGHASQSGHAPHSGSLRAEAERATLPAPPPGHEADGAELTLRLPPSSAPPKIAGVDDFADNGYELDQLAPSARRPHSVAALDADVATSRTVRVSGATESLAESVALAEESYELRVYEARTSPPPSLEESQSVWNELMAASEQGRFAPDFGSWGRIPTPSDESDLVGSETEHADSLSLGARTSELRLKLPS